jgi:hypothetical protein
MADTYWAASITIRKLPNWMPMGAITLGHSIFVKQGQAFLIPHEQKHVEQIERDGLWKFYSRYIFSRRWRTEYEAEACAISVLVIGYPLAEMAESLSSSLYLWCCSEEKAYERILYYISSTILTKSPVTL